MTSAFWFTTVDDVVALRKNLRLNQTEFWGRILVGQASGCRYEQGRNIPDVVKMLLQIAYGDALQSTEAIRALRPSEPPRAS